MRDVYWKLQSVMPNPLIIYLYLVAYRYQFFYRNDLE